MKILPNVQPKTWRALHDGFSALEMLVVIAALGLAAGLAIPSYQRYLARNDMEIGRQNVAQGIERAKFLSQVGMNDSKWGFSTDAIPGRGVLFMGESFALRDSSYDEMYSVPESITITGLTEVTFAKVTGIPSQTGEIILRSRYDEESVVTVTLGATGEVDVPQNWLEICINPFESDQQTITVPDSLWTQYQEEGAELGACSDVLSSSNSSSGGASSIPPANITIGDGSVTINQNYIVQVDVIGTALTISSGYEAPITVQLKLNGPFIAPWGDFNKPVDGNINDGDTYTYTSDLVPSGTTINFWAKSYRKTQSWQDGTQNNHFTQKKQVQTPDNDFAIILVDGDPVPDFPSAGSQPDVEEFLEPYIDYSSNTIQLQGNQVIHLFELWADDTTESSTDFQDLVILTTFTTS